MREPPLGQRKIRHRQSIEVAGRSLQPDIRLRGGTILARGGPLGGSQRVPQPVRVCHLVAIGVAGQANLAVTPLVAIDLRAAQSDALGDRSAEAQIQMHTGEDDLVRPRTRIAKEQQPLEVHVGQAHRILPRHSRLAGRREARGHQIGEGAARFPAQGGRIDVESANRQAAVVVLPQRMIEGQTRARARFAARPRRRSRQVRRPHPAAPVPVAAEPAKRVSAPTPARVPTPVRAPIAPRRLITCAPASDSRTLRRRAAQKPRRSETRPPGKANTCRPRSH